MGLMFGVLAPVSTVSSSYLSREQRPHLTSPPMLVEDSGSRVQVWRVWGSGIEARSLGFGVNTVVTCSKWLESQDDQE